MKFSDIFKYHNDGSISWLEKPSKRISKGETAGTLKKDGYIRVIISKKRIYAHRIVWEMHNGDIPEGMYIDHINHIRHDNRIENLRIVSKPDNMKNKSLYKNNKSGFSGIYERSGKYIAMARLEGRLKHIGVYDSIDDALIARREFEEQNDYHKNHGI